MDEIAALGDMLRRLRAADHSFRIFGSKQHRYRLGPPLSEAELAAFEAANRVRLPEAYRQFLSTVGNGGAGPYYGLEPLGASGDDLSQPFPFTDTLSDSELEQFSESCVYPGVLEFCHHGCAYYSYLVVNGPTYGTIWDGGHEDFCPPGPTGETFDVWYRSWLEHKLLALDNERRLMPRVRPLRVGMSRAEVLAEVGGDWQVQQFGSSVRYIAADGIPARLELDERDIVIKVELRPPFI